MSMSIRIQTCLTPMIRRHEIANHQPPARGECQSSTLKMHLHPKNGPERRVFAPYTTQSHSGHPFQWMKLAGKNGQRRNRMRRNGWTKGVTQKNIRKYITRKMRMMMKSRWSVPAKKTKGQHHRRRRRRSQKVRTELQDSIFHGLLTVFYRKEIGREEAKPEASCSLNNSTRSVFSYQLFEVTGGLI